MCQANTYLDEKIFYLGDCCNMKKSDILIDGCCCTPKELDLLESFHLYRDTDEDIYSKCHLDIVLSNRHCLEQKAAIHFSEVVDFKSEDLDSLWDLIIKIFDVSADQWEGIKYHVSEDEHGLFSFYCKDFEFKLL